VSEIRNKEHDVSRKIEKVGLIGLGKMGRPMAEHLHRKGFQVIGYDISPDAVRAVAELGIAIAKSPAEVATFSDLVIVVVGFDTEIDVALYGPKGVMEAAKPDLIIAIASTVAPAAMKDIVAKAKGEAKFLDTPLARGEPAAESGELLIFGGGDREIFEACRPAFATFANAIHYLGALGAGQVGKMVNNLILWACISANDEGLKLGRALGVAEEPLRQALLQSSASNWALETWLGQRAMPWAEKDMTIVLQEADDARLSLPLCGTIKEVIKGIKIERGLPIPKAVRHGG
jgi:3-hydroxyisobutyrate dehydrogenase-like beta-hydroxyacid dehydrogenase